MLRHDVVPEPDDTTDHNSYAPEHAPDEVIDFGPNVHPATHAEVMSRLQVQGPISKLKKGSELCMTPNAQHPLLSRMGGKPTANENDNIAMAMRVFYERELETATQQMEIEGAALDQVVGEPNVLAGWLCNKAAGLSRCNSVAQNLPTCESAEEDYLFGLKPSNIAQFSKRGSEKLRASFARYAKGRGEPWPYAHR